MAHTLAPSGRGVSRPAPPADETIRVRVDFGGARSTYLQEQDRRRHHGSPLEMQTGGAAMRFIIIVRANRETAAGVARSRELAAAMAAYHAELARAGVLLDGNRLQPSSKGFRLRWHRGRSTLIDGPFEERRDLVTGYTVIQVKSRVEGVEWAKRFPAPLRADEGREIEVRALYELDEVDPRPVDRPRKMPISTRE
jgi:hypothetical protein